MSAVPRSTLSVLAPIPRMAAAPSTNVQLFVGASVEIVQAGAFGCWIGNELSRSLSRYAHRESTKHLFVFFPTMLLSWVVAPTENRDGLEAVTACACCACSFNQHGSLRRNFFSSFAQCDPFGPPSFSSRSQRMPSTCSDIVTINFTTLPSMVSSM